MKRILRRTLAVMLGLSLGWMAAGQWGLSQTSQAFASAETAAAVEHDHDASLDAGQQAALQLGVTPDDVPWLSQVLLGVFLLFFAGLTLGYAAMKLRGPEPPDPAADHHDDHH